MAGNGAVCIVLPLLNEAAHIRTAMDSYFSQDYRPLELKIYDGGSSDGTVELLRRYPVNVRVVPGLGQMAAINRGWTETDAEFVGWMAGDDIHPPGALKALAEALTKNPEAGFSYGDGVLIDAAGRTIGMVRPGIFGLRELMSGFPVMPQSTLIRRSVLQQTGMLDESKRFAADWDFFLRLRHHSQGTYVPGIVGARRVHSGSEDALHLIDVGEASVQLIDDFFQRPDLTSTEKSLRRYGVAGSRLLAAWAYLVEGRRPDAYRCLWKAVRAHAPSVVSTRVGRRVVTRLLLPWNPPVGVAAKVYPRRYRRNFWWSKARPRGVDFWHQ